MTEFFVFLAGIWFLVALGAAVYFWATRTNPSQPPIMRRLIGFGLGLAWPIFVVQYFRQRSNEANKTPVSADRPSSSTGQPVRGLLASGRKLHSSLSVEGALALLNEVVSSYRPRRYQHLPHLVECAHEWLGTPPKPERAIYLNDSEGDFLLVTFWSTSSGCEVGMFPLGTGDERLRMAIIDHWKMRDKSLTSVGTFPDKSVALRVPTVPRDFVAGCLRDAGYPATPANLAALQQMLSEQFLLKAHQFISSRDKWDADAFVDQHRNSDPQVILDNLGNWSLDVLPYIQDMPWRIRALLLEPEVISKSPFWAGLEQTGEEGAADDAVRSSPNERSTQDVMEIDDNDLAAARNALTEYSHAASRDDGPQVVAAGLQLARAGGFRSIEDIIRRVSKSGSDQEREKLTVRILNRPWQWLEAVTQYAADRGDSTTVALAFLFSDVFHTQVEPGLGLGDLDDVGFPALPNQVQITLAELALTSFADQDLDRVIAQGSAATVEVAHVIALAATRLIEADDAGHTVKPGVVAMARRMLDGEISQHPEGQDDSDKLQEALELGVLHLAHCRKTLGEQNPLTIRAAAAIGFTQLRAGQLYEAVTTLEPAYSLAVHVLGDSDSLTLRIAMNLAAALRDTERADSARSLLEGALATSQQTLGTDDPLTLTIRSDLAATLTLLGDHAEAAAMHKQLITDRTRVLGPHHADTLTSVELLGQAYRAAGDLEKAIVQYESVTSTSQDVLGPDHPDTLSSQNTLAYAYTETGRIEEAIALHEATLAIRRRVLGAGHHHTLNSMNGLAVTYMRADRDQQALTILEEAAALCAKSLAPDHPIAKNLELNLTMARMMASSPPTTGGGDPPPPVKREGKQLRQIASFANPGEGTGFGHAWSPSGNKIAVAGFDHSVVVFDSRSGEQVLQTPSSGTVTCVSWSSDGRILASGTSQRTVHLTSVETCQELRKAIGHRDEIRSIAHSPDGGLIATAANDGHLYVWTATDLSVVTTIAAHTGRARSVAWSPDFTRLASSGQDNAVRIWQVDDWSLNSVLVDHSAETPKVAYSPDGRFLASGSLDSTVRIWDLDAQRCVHVLDANRWWVVDLAFSPDSTLLAVLSNEEILVFDLRTGEKIAAAQARFGSKSIGWGPDGRHISTVGFDADIWEL